MDDCAGEVGKVERPAVESGEVTGDSPGKTVAGAGWIADFVQRVGPGGEEFPPASEEQGAMLALLDDHVTGAELNQPVPGGDRVAIVTNAGGLGILCADTCEANGLTVPELSPETVNTLRSLVPPSP